MLDPETMNAEQVCASCGRRLPLRVCLSAVSCNRKNSPVRCIISRLQRLTRKKDRERWLTATTS